MAYLRQWWLHLLLVAALAFTVSMGVWQWDVARDIRTDKQAELMHRPTVALDSVLGPNDAFPKKQSGRHVSFTGTWLPDSFVQIEGHQGGYWVAEAMQLSSGSSVYVVLGWSKEVDGSEAPLNGSATYAGWIQPPEMGGLTDEDPTDRVLPELSAVAAMEYVSGDLYSAYVVSDTPAPGLTEATLNKSLDPGLSSGLRNFLYALEWWAFAAFAVFWWWRWLNDIVRDEAAAAEAADGFDSAQPPKTPQPSSGTATTSSVASPE